ncbi:MAG: tRNA (adenosine(37)-N6)-threonylcarbamoyltransferase complex ATPase subunit type 1 TsaE [Lachnospiraceae bacterium]|nr:tRNA (adenosine(37)-N6)-threonylcarbamoyltransferase complex ATPase subunit type 1 TsaE [Lachnospiraceae bacterium]
MIFESNSPEETFKIARQLGKQAKPGEIYCLSGELGVGKTVFSQGFASGLGIAEDINSPTFTILQTYESGKMPLYHFDVYRLGDAGEMEEIGYDDYFFGEGICLIEWAELIQEILPADRKNVRIEKALNKSYDYRKITVT